MVILLHIQLLKLLDHIQFHLQLVDSGMQKFLQLGSLLKYLFQYLHIQISFCLILLQKDQLYIMKLLHSSLQKLLYQQ